MIKINLLKEKKKKQMTFPVGGILVFLWVVTCVVGVLWFAQQCQEELEAYTERLVPLKADVAKLDRFFKEKRSMEQELNNVNTALTDYKAILSKKTGSWTKTLYRFEEFVARSKTVWVQQIRFMPDGSVSLNGTSMAAEVKDDRKKREVTTQGVTDFIKILQQAKDVVSQVNISELQHDTMEKQPVAKFNMNFQMNRD